MHVHVCVRFCLCICACENVRVPEGLEDQEEMEPLKMCERRVNVATLSRATVPLCVGVSMGVSHINLPLRLICRSPKSSHQQSSGADCGEANGIAC